jgi:Ni,Fe-hydrogenase III large subunit/Ni,Fe-hydrogenase III component G
MLPDLLQSPRMTMPSNMKCEWARVDETQWLQIAQEMQSADARLLTMWGSDDRDRDDSFRVYATYLLPASVLVVELPIKETLTPTYSGIAELFPGAVRMQRAIYDLIGITSTDREADPRGWLQHGYWPEHLYPLRRGADSSRRYACDTYPYAFVQVDGDGVHEIAVGPVHAGIIEPGHFRFSVVGEKVLRLEERLGYTHKGVALRFQGMTQLSGHCLAARISGDSAVAFSWAYCAALEAATETCCPPRALHLRALALEHERIANHLGDLGAIGNDAGFAFALTHFSRLKEDLLRLNKVLFGARYLLDYVVPGGVKADLPAHSHAKLIESYFSIRQAVGTLRTIYEDHAGLQDRFRDTGVLSLSLAQTLGALGLAARASGIACDLRVDHPFAPYDRMATNLTMAAEGDVAARVRVRFDEVLESLRLCHSLFEDIPLGAVRESVLDAGSHKFGIGLIEGWRGAVLIALELDEGAVIRRCHFHDPSWQNWPLIEHVMPGNIVADFPLINKSFNLSYSGQDG